MIEVTSRSAPGDTRWYSGAGIYRRVWLSVEGATRFAHDGVRFRTVSAAAEAARVSVEVTVIDDSDRPMEVAVELRRGGETVTAAAMTVRSGVPAAVGLTVTGPALWSADSPELYDLVVRTGEQSSPLVEHVQRVGIRTISADSRRGLLINGVPTLLRGGCLHHDNGVLGVATFRDAEFRRVRLLKEIGFNAIRSGHTPISRELLEACDEIGMFVMDELTDVWFKPKGRGDYGNQFQAWWRRDLESMIAKDRNHASVIFYSIGNENGETATAEGIAVGRDMVVSCHRMDETRLVTAGINPFLNALASIGVGLLNMGGEAESDDPAERATNAAARPKVPKKEKKPVALDDPPKMANSTLINHLMNTLNDRILTRARLPRFDSSTRGIFAELDVAGYNYGVGQYELHAKRHPHRVMVGTETNPKDIVRNWNLVEKNPFLIGDFMWTATDYLGEAGIGSWTYGAERTGLIKPFPWLTADCGAVDLIGNVTAAGLLARAAWGRLEPAIVSRPPMRVGEKTVTSNWRGTDAIATWSWSGWEGRPTEVEVYTAAAEVQLFLNGRSLGRRPTGRDHGCTAVFPTPFEPGELIAIAYDGAGRAVGRTRLTSASGELTLRLRADRTVLDAGEQDLAFVTVELVDDSGIVVPASGVALTARVAGAGTLAGFGSADPRPNYGFTGGFSATFNGSALAVIRSGAEAGMVTIRVAADGFGEQVLSLPISAPAD